ncbi:MAG: hypothetical protein ACE5NC_01990 [Anaerolineae bacterium]
MREIRIASDQADGGWRFSVEVEEKGSSRSYSVLLGRDFYEGLRTEAPPERVVRASFEFLLERESKESILSQFTIPETILRYFPEYAAEIKKRI